MSPANVAFWSTIYEICEISEYLIPYMRYLSNMLRGSMKSRQEITLGLAINYWHCLSFCDCRNGLETSRRISEVKW